jgi:hypothetical protein
MKGFSSGRLVRKRTGSRIQGTCDILIVHQRAGIDERKDQKTLRALGKYKEERNCDGEEDPLYGFFCVALKDFIV